MLQSLNYLCDPLLGLLRYICVFHVGGRPALDTTLQMSLTRAEQKESPPSTCWQCSNVAQDAASKQQNPVLMWTACTSHGQKPSFILFYQPPHQTFIRLSRHNGVALMVGLDDLRGVFQPMILW